MRGGAAGGGGGGGGISGGVVGGGGMGIEAQVEAEQECLREAVHRICTVARPDVLVMERGVARHAQVCVDVGTAGGTKRVCMVRVRVRGGNKE